MTNAATRIDETTITFNIIYMRGSVRLLFPLLQSLLRWSRCRYRIVGNDISEDEIAFLRQFVAAEPRTELHLIARNGQPLYHEDALYQLVQDGNDEYVAFCDSDIVVDGPFLESLLSALASADAVFSGAPVGIPRSGKIVQPNALKTIAEGVWDRHGAAIGSTYLAIIRRSVLERALAEHRDGFRRTTWDTLPFRLRRQLARSGHRHFWYDTGRVLFCTMLAQGARFAWSEPATLHHLGGYSWRTRAKSRQEHGGAGRRAQDSLSLTTRLWRRLYRVVYRPAANDLSFMKHQNVIFRYFRNLLEDQPGTTVLPPRTGDDEVDRRVEAAGQAIIAARQLS